MDLGVVVQRVERRLAAVGKSAAAASREADLSEDAIRNMQRAAKSGGRKGVSTATIAALAPVLKTSVGWLLKGDGDEEGGDRRTVRLVGYVGAGAEAHFYSSADEGLGEVDAPADLWSSDLRAAEIRGESLGPILENWLIFFGEERRGVPQEHYHQLCVVGLPNGQVLVKKVVPAKADGFFHLKSNSGEGNLDDQQVEWSAKVKDMRPR